MYDFWTRQAGSQAARIGLILLNYKKSNLCWREGSTGRGISGETSQISFERPKQTFDACTVLTSSKGPKVVR